MIPPNQQTHPCPNADMVHGAPKHKVIDWPPCSKSVPNTFPPGKATGNQRQKGHRIQHSGLHDRIGSFGGVFAKSKWRGKTEGFEVWETAKEWLVATKKRLPTLVVQQRLLPLSCSFWGSGPNMDHLFNAPQPHAEMARPCTEQWHLRRHDLGSLWARCLDSGFSWA